MFACENIMNGETKAMELRRIPLVRRIAGECMSIFDCEGKYLYS
jgi:hypothetical protein